MSVAALGFRGDSNTSSSLPVAALSFVPRDAADSYSTTRCARFPALDMPAPRRRAMRSSSLELVQCDADASLSKKQVCAALLSDCSASSRVPQGVWTRVCRGTTQGQLFQVGHAGRRRRFSLLSACCLLLYHAALACSRATLPLPLVRATGQIAELKPTATVIDGPTKC